MILWSLNLNFSELLTCYRNCTSFYISSVHWLLLPSNDIASISVPTICHNMSWEQFLMWRLIDAFIFQTIFSVMCTSISLSFEKISLVHLEGLMALILHACYGFKSKTLPIEMKLHMV